MKPLSEMTPSEAIAYTVGKVPECGHGPGGCSVSRECGLALFFSAAWEWLKNQPGTYDLCPMHGAWGVFHADTSRGLGVPALYPTKTHALAAAVLLAKGEVVP